ncbi:MAG: hypothetical protein RR216_02400 [Pseudoflavonifractor sp.]
MEQRFSMGGAGGTLLLHEEGPRAYFDADLPDDKRGLYKAYLVGSGGRLLLGTLMPEYGRLRLRRTITTDELRRQQVWPPTGAEAVLAFGFAAEPPRKSPVWVREDDPGRLLGDRLLAGCAEGLCGGLILRTADGFSLALPYERGRAFPMTPLFCFAHIAVIGAREYAVFYFNVRGCPTFEAPKKEEVEGQK